MKQTYSFLLLFIFLFLSSCNSKNKYADAYGNFEAEETIISSTSNGNLLEFTIEEGQNLKKNTLVGKIDNTDLLLQKKQLIARKKILAQKIPDTSGQLSVFDQQLSNLNIDKKRVENLIKSKAATSKQLDDLNAQINLIKSQRESYLNNYQSQKKSILSENEVIQSQIAQLDDKISKCLIINPMDGTVLGKYVQKNELVNYGKPLYKISNFSTLFLKAYVSETQLSQIKLGQEVILKIDSTNNSMTTFKGTITWISNKAEFTPKIIQTKDERINLVYAIKVSVDNKEGYIKIGMPGELFFK